MSGVATALAASAVIGAVASNKASSKAAKAQGKSSDAATRETRRASDEARADLNRLFPEAQLTAQQGFQSALDVFGQSLPAQTDAFTQGNVGAQQAILSGLPQIQNALFGGNVDFSQMQPFQVQQPDLSFFQQQIPQIAKNAQREQDRVAQLEVDTNNFFDRTRGSTVFEPSNPSRFLAGGLPNPFNGGRLTRQNFK